jgi:hypothetical protein
MAGGMLLQIKKETLSNQVAWLGSYTLQAIECKPPALMGGWRRIFPSNLIPLAA